jgi:hypothetical protein
MDGARDTPGPRFTSCYSGAMLRAGRAIVAALLGAVVLSSPSASLGQPPATPPGGPAGVAPPVSLGALIDQAVALFPALEGEVIEVREQTLTLALPRPRGVRPGLVLEVFREGREIRHPRTGEILGKAEDQLGRAVVSRVFEGYSLAVLEGRAAEAIRVGDRVRAPGGKVKLTLLALPGPGIKQNMLEAVTGEIYEGLSRSGRFQVILGDQVGLWLAQQKIAPEDFLQGRGVAEAAERFKADNLLVVHLYQAQRRPFVESRLFSGGRPEPILSQSFFVPATIKPVQAGRFSTNEGSGSAPPQPKPRSLLARLLGGDIEPGAYSSAEASIPLREVARFPFMVVSMDVAVAPADQVPRVALSDGDRVYLYRLVNHQLEAEWSHNVRYLGRVFSVQLADLTGDGVPEVVVNRFDTRIGMNSLILGTEQGKPVTLVDKVDVILLAVDEKGTGLRQTLWGQRYREETFFNRGFADEFAVRNGALVRERRALVPDTFRATGAAFSNIMGKDSRALVSIDERNRLRVHAGTDELWASSSPVGGGGQKIEVVRYIERGGRSFFYQMEPIPLSVDLDGDGVQEVVVPANQGENAMLAVVYRGPAGLRFQYVASGFEGVITGLGALPGEDGAPPALIAAVVRYSNFFRTSGETQIIMAVQE